MKKRTTSRKQKEMVLRKRKSSSRQSVSSPGQAPGPSSRIEGLSSDPQFEERLQAVRRSAREKKKMEEKKEFWAIDYDAPVEQMESTVGLGAKIGVGVAVVVFGLVFAFGDFLPSGSISSNEDDKAATRKLSKGQRTTLEERLHQFKATLSSSPKDLEALEGAAVTSAELGEYTKAAAFLENLSKEKPSDPDVLRLLGEVRFELKEYEASEAAYRSSAKVSNTLDFEVLHGLTNTLLAAKKPYEAVHVLLEYRKQVNMEKADDLNTKIGSSSGEKVLLDVDPVQVDLLLGKAYSDWGHTSDATSVYDQLISSHPNDFRGYLAKGILLKDIGNAGEAERMFIQARFFAPEKAKSLVDRYTRH